LRTPEQALEVADWVQAPPLGRVSARTVQRAVAVAIVPMVAVTMGLALTSDRLQKPLAAALYWGYLVAASMAIGLYWWIRRPASRFGPLLALFGTGVWVVSWQGANAPLAFDLGVFVEPPFFLLTIYLFLAFPMGRIESRLERRLMGALGLGAILTFLPWALLSPVIAGGGPLTSCAPDCPANALQVASAPDAAEAFGKAEIYTALVLVASVFVVYLRRLLRASRPQRRQLIAVAVTSLLFLPAWFVSNFARTVLELGDQSTLDTLAWAIVVARILLPLGFLVALLQADRFAARALQGLLMRLAARPTPDQWREAIAGALDDAELRLAFYEPSSGRFLEAGGEELRAPLPAAARVWVPVGRGGRQVAAMVIDRTLAEDPELVRAAASATLLAVENGALEGELRASRARIVQAGDAERRRIERDLHDSAQQRLVALRIHLSAAGERLDRPAERAMLERLGTEVEDAIDDLRTVAHGIYPQVLADGGVGAALTEAARRSPVRTSVLDGWSARQPEAVESTVYFCCLECLQNAAKHGGPGVSATVRLGERHGRVSFVVEDDGPGFDASSVSAGSGLTNLLDRVTAVGGTLEIDSAPGRGTRISGELPDGAA
jgi:signal transduction histidine kinase